jgi:hypothetical protein
LCKSSSQNDGEFDTRPSIICQKNAEEKFVKKIAQKRKEKQLVQ